MTSPAKLSYIAKLVCVDSLLFGNDYKTMPDIQNLVDNFKNIPVKKAWPENIQSQGAEFSDTTNSQRVVLTEFITTQRGGCYNDTEKEEAGPTNVFPQTGAGHTGTGSHSIEEYLTQLLETGFFTAVSEDILIRLVEYYPFRLTNRLFLALLPPYAKEINLFNCTERLTLMGLVDGLKKCRHLQRLNLQSCTHLLHSDLFNLIGLVNDQLSTLILEGNSNVTDEIVQTAIKALPNLTSLNISCCGSISDDVFLLDPVLQLKRETSQKPVRGEYLYKLSSVDMSGISSISSVAVRHLISLCGPNLRQLNLAWSTQVDSTALFYLAGYNFPTIIDLVLGRQSELTQERELKGYITELREIKELYLIKDKRDKGKSDDTTSSGTTAESSQSVHTTLVEKDIANLESFSEEYNAYKDTGQSKAVKEDQCSSPRMEIADLDKESANVEDLNVQLDQGKVFCSDNTLDESIADPNILDESVADPDIKNLNIRPLHESGDCSDQIKNNFDVPNLIDELTCSALNSAKRIAEVTKDDGNSAAHDSYDTVQENDSNSEISHDADGDAHTEFSNNSNSGKSDLSETEDISNNTNFVDLDSQAECVTIEEDEYHERQMQEGAKNTISQNKSVINEASSSNITESYTYENDTPEKLDLMEASSDSKELDEDGVNSSVDPVDEVAKRAPTTCKSAFVKPMNNNNNNTAEDELCGQEVFKPGIISLDITNIKFVNRKLGQLCLKTFLHKNPGLKKIEVSWKGLTEEFLKEVLPNLKELVEASLQECTFIQNGGLAALLRHCQSLRSINLRGVIFFKDMAMTPMYTMSNLTKLYLAESEISDTSLFRISNRLNEKLTDIDLSYCEGITEQGINYICMKCTQLQSMVLHSCPVSNITLHVMSKNCPNMRELLIDSVEGVSGNEFSDTGLLDVAENLLLLETLDISWNISITNLAICSLMNNLFCLKEVHMKGLKQITCTPFLPIISGVRDDKGSVKEFWVDEYCNNLRTASCLRRSTVFSPNLRVLGLEYSDLVEDKRLELIVKVCRGSLEVTDYYGRYLVPDESSNLVISTASCRI